MRFHPVRSAFALILIAGVPQAFAGPIHDPTTSNCTTANCSSVVLGGTLLSLGTGSAGQWVQEVFARAGQCVRLQVTQESLDLAMTVVAPNGAIYENDQGGGACTSCPNVKIGNAPRTGWYTVSVAHFDGAAAEGSFTLAYGTYPAGNANCSAPTPPFSTAAPVSRSTARGGDVAPTSAPPLR
jgi:hypothetical protein